MNLRHFSIPDAFSYGNNRLIYLLCGGWNSVDDSCVNGAHRVYLNAASYDVGSHIDGVKFFLADGIWYAINRPDYYLCIGGTNDGFLSCGPYFLSLSSVDYGAHWHIVKKSSR